MFVRLLSDLHLEGFKFEYQHAGEDVLVLAGDIHTRNRLHLFLDQVPEHIPVLFVAGNHEFYHSDFDNVIQYHRGLESRYNFRCLNNQATEINGIPVFGGTMFTDFNLDGNRPVRMFDAQVGINDFRFIRRQTEDGVRLWSPEDHLIEHELFCRRLDAWIAATTHDKRIVITHFVPTPKCIHPQWHGSPLNSYFTVDMERFMGWDGLWLFGHTHDSADVRVGNTRVVGNPKGYGGENHNFNPSLLVEL